MRHDYPDGYRPMSYCRSCGRDFAGDTYFDRHRIGSQATRRCRGRGELRKLGLRPLTDAEMNTRAHRHRIGFGVEMWGDPRTTDLSEKKAGTTSRSSERSEGLRREPLSKQGHV